MGIKKRYKVVHIIPCFNQEAAEETLRIGIGLDKNKYEVFLISGMSFTSLPKLKREADAQGITFVTIPELRQRRGIWGKGKAYHQIFKVLKKGNFDISHLCSFQREVLGRLVVKYAGIKKNVSLFFGNICHGVRLRDFYFDEEFKKDKKREIGLNVDTPLLGTTGPLGGCRFLIMAMVHVVKKVPSAKLIIMGDGLAKRELKYLARRLDVTDNIIFLGKQKERIEMLAALDLFVFPALNNRMFRPLVEAMALSKPVIVSSLQILEHVVDDGQSGFVVPAKESAALAMAILKLLEDSELAEKMGRVGREKVEKEFTEEKMMKDVNRIYDECLKGIE